MPSQASCGPGFCPICRKMLTPGCGGVPGEGQLRDRVDASVALSAPRSRRMARALIVLLALVWTQFPFGGGGGSAEGDHELALCWGWGEALDDGELTVYIALPGWHSV